MNEAMSVIRCDRCHRVLKRPPVVVDGGNFGPKCAASFAAKLPRVAREDHKPVVDERQTELWDNSLRARAVRLFDGWWRAAFGVNHE